MKTIKRILILTDSLGLPRELPELVSYNSTWIQRVKEKSNYELHEVSIGGATIDLLWKQFNYHRLFNPDLIIIQCGIVDCAPRALRKAEDLLINSNFLTRNLARFILPKMIGTLRRVRNISLTDSSTFSKYLKQFSLLSVPILFIEIVPATDNYENSLPGIRRNIGHFNKLINEVFRGNSISLSAFTELELMSDQHHLNDLGHKKLAELILERLMMI